MAKTATSKSKKPEKAVTVKDAGGKEEKKEPTMQEQITELQKAYSDHTELTEMLFTRQIQFEINTVKRLKGHNEALRFAMYAIAAICVAIIVIVQADEPKRYWPQAPRPFFG